MPPKPRKTPVPPKEGTEPAAEWLPTSALRPWADNPRKNDEAVAAVAASIKRFGFGAPILARRANREIIAGHTRWKAAQQLGLDSVPVRLLDLDPVDAHLLALADNRLGEEASWNDEMLAAVLADLKAHEADLAATGFSDGELAKLLSDAAALPESREAPDAEPSRADELRAKWGTEPGQLWTIESHSAPGKTHRLLCGDSTKADDVARVMGAERAACMWADPPYGVAYVGKTRAKLTLANDRLTGERLYEFLCAAFVAADKHALAPGAAIYIAHPAGALSLQFLLAFEHAGWRLHQTLVWVKDRMVLGHSDYHYAHEPVLFGYTPGEGRRGRGGDGWFGDNAQTSVFQVPRPKASEEHPTMKPPELVAAMVRNSAPAGGLVFEPFSGSGSTLAACEGTGRACNAIELDPKYVAVALERMLVMGLSPCKSDRTSPRPPRRAG
jgi:ParB/RepB/Spo0J family partition protein